MSDKPRVLQIHNEYLIRGGEERVLKEEFDLLQSRGHEVRQFIVRNADADTSSPAGKVGLAVSAVWSTRFKEELARVLEEFKPDVAHVHNPMPLLSPTVFRRLSKSGCRVVTTMHNYRIICVSYLLLRDGKVCTDCLTGSRLNGIVHACYRGSRFGSSCLALSNAIHKKTYQKYIDCIIAINPLAKSIFEKYGLPSEKLLVKPNFVGLPPVEQTQRPRKKAFTFIGRISPEKGIDLLLKAWSGLDVGDWELLLAGEGPSFDQLQNEYEGVKGIRWLGRIPRNEVEEIVSTSRWLLLPSICYEMMSMAVLEAFSFGTPAIVSRLGAMPDWVEPTPSGLGAAGLVFSLEGEPSLRTILGQAIAQDEDDWQQFSANARESASTRYSADVSYDLLMKAYGIKS